MSIKRLLFIAGLAAVAGCARPGPFEFCTPEPGQDQEETVCPQNYHADGANTDAGTAVVVPDPEE